MIALLSPAKTLDMDAVKTTATQPRLLERAEPLVRSLKRRSAADLQELMHISEKLAELNRVRYRDFETPFTEENAKPALLAFKGDVYQGLDADTMSEDDLDFAQDHLRLLSGLYGLLRPRDLMQAYRLEMGTKLPTRKGKDLYAYWGDDISTLLREDLQKHDQKTIVNLASQEYYKSVRPDVVGAPVLHIHFKEERGGQLKVIAFNAKKARGRMARLIIDERLSEPEGLKDMAINGYRYRKTGSDAHNWLFIKN